MSKLAIILPTLNEEHYIERTLLAAKACAPDAEFIVVDGGSHDTTVAKASRHVPVIQTQCGRGHQLNMGAAATQGDILLFLHADTIPDPAGIQELLTMMEDIHIVGGAFRMCFDDSRPLYRRISANVTRRSLKSKSYTGDQGIFTRRSTFEQLGGYQSWPFMEDVDYSERMSRAGSVILLASEVETSARRHRKWGLLRTQLTVIIIRVLYLFKIHPVAYAWLWPEVR